MHSDPDQIPTETPIPDFESCSDSGKVLFTDFHSLHPHIYLLSSQLHF